VMGTVRTTPTKIAMASRPVIGTAGKVLAAKVQ
jgi:hypothetical protein